MSRRAKLTDFFKAKPRATEAERPLQPAAAVVVDVVTVDVHRNFDSQATSSTSAMSATRSVEPRVDDDVITVDTVALDSQSVVVDDDTITVDTVALDSQSVGDNDDAITVDHVALDSQSVGDDDDAITVDHVALDSQSVGDDDDAITIDHVALDSQSVVVDDDAITVDPVALDSQSVVGDDDDDITIDHVALDNQSNEACATDVIPVRETPAARKTTSSVSTTSPSRTQSTAAPAPRKRGAEVPVDVESVDVSAPASKAPRSHPKFLQSWLGIFPWVTRDAQTGNISCTVCKMRNTWECCKKDTLQKHENSNRHKANVQTLKNKKEAPLKQALVTQAAKTDEKTHADMQIKFNCAMFIAKEELPFTKYRPLLELHMKNGMDISATYATDKKCAEIIGTIADGMSSALGQSLLACHYLAVTIDGATDRSASENEAVCVRFWDMTTNTRLVSLKALKHAHADGVLAAVIESFDDIGLSSDTLLGKLVAFTADGAAVNLGHRGGVAAKLRADCPWLIDVWCMPHRLDLAVRKMVKNCPPAAQVIDVLELVYKTYHYSPKSQRELYELGAELDVAVLSPSRAKGTRWSPHIQRAMAVMLRPAKGDAPAWSIATVLQHMEHLAASSVNADIMGRGKHVSRLMLKVDFVVMCHFIHDVFTAVSKLALTLQNRNTTLTTALNAVRYGIASLDDLLINPSHGMANLFALDGRPYQPLHLTGGNMPTNMTDIAAPVRKHMKNVVSAVTDGMKTRFSTLLGNFDQEAGPAKAVAALHVLDPDQWPEREHVLDFGTEEVAFLIEWFAVPLTRQGCAVGEVLSQWRALKFEVVSNANLKNRSFFSLWETMLTKDTYREQYKDIVHLALIYMAIPVSAAENERIMSTMKRIKSDQRSSLHVSTTNDLIRISNDTVTVASY